MKEETLLQAFNLMSQSIILTELYEKNKEITSKYVHATSRGHEAIQIALGMQLKPFDWVSPYYRDDSLLLSIGMTPYELMLQLLAKYDDPFSAGKTYYSHPSLNDDDKPKIIHQSSATGMQAIPTTGIAMGIKYKENTSLEKPKKNFEPVVVCSMGDASITEGEVSEAFQMASLKQLPILFLVQDNEWDISAYSDETRVCNAHEYSKGFGLESYSIDGTNFIKCFNTVEKILKKIRKDRKPILLHAKVPLLNHHTSGVRMEWYRDDIDESKKRDPFPKLRKELVKINVKNAYLNEVFEKQKKIINDQYSKAVAADDPKPECIFDNIFAENKIKEEKGIREPNNNEPVLMVDAALFAIKEIMLDHPEAVLYGQDVGKRLGGVFREAATLAQQFGDDRVFNTPIQEAFILGSTVGMSAVGLKPIVEIQFADYMWPALNQLFSEVSRSNYLSNGKWPVSTVIRVPIGAYGSGGPYHSSSIESVLTSINGIKIAYPSNGADLKGLIKSAFYDPNPTIILEHKGLYWSKIKGTEKAKTIEPDKDYILPFGIARTVKIVDENESNKISIITYGMGVYWSENQYTKNLKNIEIIDIRTLSPIDYDSIFNSVKKCGKCIVVTEEPKNNSFAQALSGSIQENCFEYLDAPIIVIGSENIPAIPLNSNLEKRTLPSVEKVNQAINELISY